MNAFLAPSSLVFRHHRLGVSSPLRPPCFARNSSSRSPVMVAINSETTDTSTSDEHSPLSDVPLVSSRPEWKALKSHKEQVIDNTHLRDLLKDNARNDSLVAEYDGVYLDYSRQRATQETMKLLFDLARATKLEQRLREMVSGVHVNTTENRAALHTALRAGRNEKILVDGENVVDQVYEELGRIKRFVNRVRGGSHRGVTGRRIKNFVVVGIGGSYLGPDFVFEALKTDVVASATGPGAGFSLHFLANVDPVDVVRALDGFDPEETMAIVVSKTFTTRETIVNAKTVRAWLWDALGRADAVVQKHVVACSTNMEKTAEFGISDSNVFPFWDWVGGRFSVCSSVGALPLSLMYGYDIFERFLAGARSIDKHLVNTPLERNIPVLLGLTCVWNMSFLGHMSQAMHPYTEALTKLAPHIQQLDMESNGKYVTRHGVEIDFDVGPINFGEPGTLGQHSFFQLLHMGQVVPCTFIGFIESQNPTCQDGEPVSNHDELMSNFFAQPDALATGKTAQECRDEGRPDELIPHVTFTGNRPSLTILLPALNAYTCGQLLALFEHRTAVQGFIWDINSFDQWGVELGKVLATRVRKQINLGRYHGAEVEGFNSSTTNLIKRYLSGSVGCAFDGFDQVFDEK